MTLAAVSLDDKYTVEKGRLFLTGTQALVRLPMLQRQRDLAAGLNTACYISGYRGSPLGLYDQQLWRAKRFLKENHIHFQPGVNEDMAATAIWGSQQVGLYPGARYDGVFGIWYGKGPGVDRTLDVFRHGNMAGTSPHGGVLALAGDDHAAVSSTTAHQTEVNFQAVGMPVLHAASVQEYLTLGLLGIALSRFSGLWVGFKCMTETVEGAASVDLDPHALSIVMPDFTFPPGEPGIRPNDIAFAAQDHRLFGIKLPSALAFARANRLDRITVASPRTRLGIVTTGKSHGDVRQALDDLGLTERKCAEIGLAVYKVAMVWPLEPEGLRAFATGVDELLVIEEKRPVLEPQVKEALYHLDADRRPIVTGKTDERGAPLLPSAGELGPGEIARAIATRLERFHSDDMMRDRLGFLAAKLRETEGAKALSNRLPYFCSGCPHNTSTKVPDGSRAMAGIGCHTMAVWMNRSTGSLSQMGGEGVAWLGQAPFTDEEHVFANMGDGTFYHSGLLAIRTSIAAGVNITYKLLFNDAVAMTGGQPVDGQLNVADITHILKGEGAEKIVVVADDPDKYPTNVGFAAGTEVRPREELDAVQRELRETPGCTVLIYDQVCAAEKRRRRKRGTFPDPDKRAFINDAVCEGCGDCSVKSNCVSVEPLETEFGRKRQINQSSCNKDFSCVNGFCPSFVTVSGAKVRRAKVKTEGNAEAALAARFTALPQPALPVLDKPWDVLITGIGGTGVVTIGQIMAMAAHVQGHGVTVLDNTGLSQKNGAVTSHVRIGPDPAALHAVRIGPGNADLLLACDMVVAADPRTLSRTQKGATHAVVNTHLTPTAEFTLNPAIQFRERQMLAAVKNACGDNLMDSVDATGLATALMGDAIATNMFLLGYAFQRGLVPVTLDALERAIEINGATVEANKRALAWGRLAAHDVGAVEQIAKPITDVREPHDFAQTLDEIVAVREKHLTAWQNAAWAEQYRALVDRVRKAEADKARGCAGLAEAVARNAAKLMSYKDEYEVARLYTDGAFLRKLRNQFDGDLKLTFHLAPPLIAERDPVSGELKKRPFGPWILSAFKVLAKLKGLRGTAFDLFGRTTERRMERQLITDYVALVDEVLAGLNSHNHALAVQLAELPDQIRGFGHVKERNLKAVKEKEATLLTAFRNPAEVQAAAE